nr:DUF692 domain-containing protein [uncultured Caldimonas sp.]
MTHPPQLGLGLGWRPELALMIDRCTDLGFVEVVAEHFFAPHGVPTAVHMLRERGLPVVPHGLSLSLGSAEPLERDRLRALAAVARELDAPLVSEHLAFVRANGIESGHLLPVPRTREALEVVVRHVKEAQAALPVPLAIENIASLFEWPEAEFGAADFLNEVLDRTGAWLLLDIENLYADSVNHGLDAHAFLQRLDLSRLAYVHVAGGLADAQGFYHDTHAHAVPSPVMSLLAELCKRCRPAGVMLERDDLFPDDDVLLAELDAMRAATGHAGPLRHEPG